MPSPVVLDLSMHILGAHLPQDTLLPRSRVRSVGSAMSQDTVLLLHVIKYL